MSRIGKQPVSIPSSVSVSIEDNVLSVKGPDAVLSCPIHPSVDVRVEDGQVIFSIADDDNKKYRGTMRSLCANMIEGVTNGFEKRLVVLGVGYGAEVKGDDLILSLGFSHKVVYAVPSGVTIVVDKTPSGDIMLVIRSPDKQKLGQTAAEIRSYRKPDVYKGKGIRYLNEYIKLKPTKSVKK